MGGIWPTDLELTWCTARNINDIFKIKNDRDYVQVNLESFKLKMNKIFFCQSRSCVRKWPDAAVKPRHVINMTLHHIINP